MSAFLAWTAIGAGQVLLMTLVLALCGSLRLRRQRPDRAPSRLWSTNPVVMVGLVLCEEWVFRSLLVGFLAPRVGALWAIGIAALAFTLAHVPNGVANVWTPANLLLFSVFAGLVYLKFGLAAVTGLHYGWNLMQWPILGYPMYGGGRVGRWFQMETPGPTWLTGGEAGPESGIAETTVLTLAVVALWLLCRQKVI